MKSKFYIIFPIIFGILSAFFLYTILEDEIDVLLTQKNLLENGSPIIGNPSAPITILEWGDYQCTYCYRFHESSLNTILDEYVTPGKVNLIFKDFPLNGPDSVLASEASYCAEDQGKYWKYHDKLYTNWGGERTGWINEESLNKFAVEVGLDLVEFNSCMNAHKYLSRVLDLEKFGRDVGIDATPSFLVFNDEKIIKITGNQPVDIFRKVINDLDSK
jgi:protein-disulfide isomerase